MNKDKLIRDIDYFKSLLSNEESSLEEMVDAAKSCIESIKTILHECHVNPNDKLSKEVMDKITFVWADESRHFGLLLRDIIFSKYKNTFAQSEQSSDDEVLNIFNIASEELIENFQKIIDRNPSTKSPSKKWEHQLSTIPLIIAQLDEISSQLSDIHTAYGALLSLDADLNLFRSQFDTQLDHYISGIDGMVTNLKKLHQDLGEIQLETAVANLENVSKSVEKTYRDLETKKINFLFPELVLKTVKESNIPISVKGGELIYKKIHLSEHINQWIRERVDPHVFELYQDGLNLFESGLLALFNTKSRLQLLKIDREHQADRPISFLTKPIQNFLDVAESLEFQAMSDKNGIQAIMEENLHLSGLFNKDKFFLDIDDSTLRFVNISPTAKWIDKHLVSRVKGLVSKVKSILPRINQNHGSEIMRVIDFIRYQSVSNVDSFNQSLFLSKGYLGKSFFVGRQHFDEILIRSIEQWKLGYRGSMLLYGARLSGKSSICDSILARPDILPTITLKPDQVLNINGRKMEMGIDLGKALEFIHNQTLNHSQIVIIDDIEMWRSKDLSLMVNITSLCEAIQKYNKSLYLVVATNTWMKEYLDQFLNFSGYFGSSFRTDSMSSKDIAKAILIRHVSSAREDHLLDLKEIEKENSALNAAKKIAKLSNYNIGVSIRSWYRQVSDEDPEIIQFRSHSYKQDFNNFIVHYEGILKFFLKFKKSQESELRDYLGTSQFGVMASDIQKLVSLGILERGILGVLKINEDLVDEIEEKMSELVTHHQIM